MRHLRLRGLSPGPTALAVALLAVPILHPPLPASGQEPEAEQDHAMHGMAMEGGWRMPPMRMEMPMLPGLEGAVPPVRPFLPGAGIDVASLPEARPSEIVDMEDGDTLDLPVTLVRRTIAGHEMVMYGYDGQHPGPLIRAPRGATVVVRVTNEIRSPTTVHWHGIRLENRFDGVPGLTQEPIGPGESFVYEVRVPDAGMFWYHPHVREDVQQDLGLFGNLLVRSPDPDHLAPVHREELLVVDDILLDDRGPIPYGEEAATHALMGRFGNVMMVNGRAGWSLDVRPGEVVRFYVTNVANTRTFNLRFGESPVKLVASDLGRYEQERWVGSVPIAPAERYVVDVRFDEPGTAAVTNSIQAVDHFRGTFVPRVDTLGLVRVSGEPLAGAPADAFPLLREPPGVPADMPDSESWMGRPPDRELVATVRVEGLPVPIVQSMEMDTLYVPPVEWNDVMPMMNWLSTADQVEWILREPSTGLENGEIDWSFRQGDLVKLRIHNAPDSFHPMQHPIHVHGQRFLVLAVDGVEAVNRVWKDTALVPVGSTVDFLVEMSNPGDWMLHCHIAEHLHSGMMLTFTVDPADETPPTP